MKNKLSTLLIASLLMLGFSLQAQAPAHSRQETAAETAARKPGLKIGDQAPDFSLKGVDDKTYSLRGLTLANGESPKGYVVAFTCNTCPFAQKYEDRLIELSNKMQAKGYVVVAIQPNDPTIIPGDSFGEMKRRAQTKSYPFPYLLDEGQQVYPQYGAERTPTVYVLDKDLRLRYMGAIDDNAGNAAAVKTRYVEAAVAALDAKKEVNPKETKSVGCMIKARKPAQGTPERSQENE